MQASSRFETIAGGAITISARPVPGQWPDGDPAPLGAPFPIDVQTDVDFSDPISGIVQSIRVFHLRFQQRRGSDGNCFRLVRMTVGRYDAAGDFVWINSTPSVMPQASEFKLPNGCGNYRFRSVLVDWRDHMERYAYEEVKY